MHSLKKSVKPKIVNRYDLWVLQHKIGGAKVFVNNVQWSDQMMYVGSSESKAKGSFGQKEFYFSNMGETALEEEPRGTLNMIFLKINHLPIL
jgi:hypothetical protein